MTANRRRPSAKKTTQHQRQAQRRQAASARRQAGPATGAGAGSGQRPLPPGSSMLTPDATPLRRRVERRSAPLLMVMHQLPRWIVPLLMAALFGIGVIVPGPVGIAALVILIAFLSWLSYLSWPAVNGKGRLIRVALLVLLIGLTVTQIVQM